MLPSVVLLGVMLALLSAVVFAVAKALVVAQPDERLLCIRDGRLVRAGVGISLWRRPGDVVARLTSTVQRVGFSVNALSHHPACALTTTSSVRRAGRRREGSINRLLGGVGEDDIV